MVMGQTAALEFAAGAGNPTGNGPTVSNQVITFQNNTDNPTGNTFAATTPAVTATYVLSNQTYNTAPNISTANGTSFGATINNAAATAVAQPVFPVMNNPFTSYPNSTYTSGGAIPAGSGIDVAANNSVGLFNSVEAIPAGSSNALTARYLFSRLTITFSQPIVNPVVHITDMGGNTGALGFTTDLNLVPATGVSLSKLSGPAPFEVTAGQIRNNSTTLPAANFTSGTARVTTSAAGITSIAFDLYVHGDGTGAWPAGAAGTHSGDLFFVGISVAPVADVATSITASTNRVVVGQPLRFDVTYTNAGPNEAAGYTQTLQLSAGLGAGNVSFTNLSAGVTAAYNNSTGVVTFTGTPTTLASGANQNLTVNIAAVPSTLASVTASSTVGTTANQGADIGPNSATSNVPVSTATDLSTTLSGPTSVTQGNEVTLNVTTTNNGPATSYNVVQTVQLVAGLTNMFVSNNGTYNSSTGVVTFPSLPSLASGQTATNYVSFKAPATTLTPTATVTPNTTATGDTNPINNTASLNGTPGGSIVINPASTNVANLYTTIAPSAQTVNAGSNVSLTVVTGNAGPATAYNVAETVQLQPGLSGLLINGAAATGPAVGNEVPYANGNKYNTQTGVVTFAPLTTLASAGTATNTLTFATPATMSGPLLATAAVSSTSTTLVQATTDPVPADNVAATKIMVAQTNADLAATIVGPAPSLAGQPITYTATFTNNGASAASNAVATVQLPAGLSGVTVSQGTYNATTGVVTFPTVASAAPGTALSYTISYTPTATGTYNASANYTSSSPDGAPANNTASTSTSVAPSADLAILLTGPASVAVSGPVTYVAETTNNGPSTSGTTNTTIQLPTGLVGPAAPVVSATGLYSPITGVVTFTNAALASGASVTNFATYTNTASTAVSSTATVSNVVAGTVNDPNSANNSSTTASVNPSTSALGVDLSTTVTPSATSVAPGSSVDLTVAFSIPNSNNPVGSISEVLYLPPGTVVTSALPTGATYNINTGVLVFTNNAVGTKKATTSSPFIVTVTAPTVGSLTALSNIYGPYSDATLANNVASTTVTLTSATPGYDESTTLTGPASALPGSAVTYTVQSVNSGPSNSGAVTQVVTLPAGTVVTNSNGGVVSSAGTSVTITYTFANQAPGVGAEVANSFTATMPATGSLPVSVATTATGETGPATNNSASLTTTQANQAPVAADIVNTLMNPLGNTAGPQLISPLAATDADGTIASYQLTSIPNAATQGTLYYNNAGTLTAITSTTQALTPAQAQTLKFAPVSSFVGNVTFAYTAIDNLGSVSTPALYTIQVGQDNAALYGTTPVKGGTTANGLTKYAANDVIAFVSDVNAARYNSSGLLYNTTTGALAPGAANGLATTGTNATTDAAGTTLLAAQGLVLNAATGQITVSDPTKLVAGTYTVNITTTDLNGGVTTQPVTYTIGAKPLPAELTAFTTTAKSLDALLTWRTASEKNNDHFDVERSLNGSDFAKIVEVKGQGTSTSATDYARIDAGIGAKVNGFVYYRLKQVDTDGTSSYSPVRSVRFGKVAFGIALFPNPAINATNLDLTALPAGAYQVSVLDAAGRVVLTTTLEAGQAHALPLNTIASGSYLLLVRGANGGQVVNLAKRLIKE